MTETLRQKLIRKGWVTDFDGDTLVNLIENHYNETDSSGEVFYEFVVQDADYCTQAGGTAPTESQAIDEGLRYLAMYRQDGMHTLEVRRVQTVFTITQGSYDRQTRSY